MQNIVTISRYSNDGFAPKYQSHHLNLINYHCIDFKKERFPKHIRSIMQSQHLELLKAYLEHRSSVEYGVWCFLAGHEVISEMSHRAYIPRFYKARIVAETMVYTKLLDKKLPITSNIFKKSGFFIPETSLSNILDKWEVVY